MADADLDFNVHPDAEKLQGFGQGLLAPEEAATLEEHLAVCDECCRHLEAMPNDSFVGQLREAQDIPSPDTQPFAPGYSIPADESVDDLADHPRYRVIRLLGRGGMGAVYLAEHRRMGRLVALKVINPELLNHSGALLRFQQEVKTAAKLDHANIVAAYDADQAGNSHFLVMEYVEGLNLSDYLAENGPLPVAQACDIIRQAALGLQHAHERGMVHRDIKPHNLMLTPSGQVKVLDFGLARFATESTTPTNAGQETLVSHLTGAGTVMGTADYIAPEQARDAHLADGRSDVYSLGCTLYYLLTGQPPFPTGTTREKVQLHSTNFPLWLRDVRPEIPEGLARIVAKMMAKKPEDRYQTAAEVAAALKPLAGNIRPKRTKVRRAVLAVAMVAAAALLAGVVWMLRPATDQKDELLLAQPQTVIPPGADRTPQNHVPLLTIDTDNLPVHAVAISPDEKLVAAGGGLWRHRDGWAAGGDCDVRLFERESGKEVRRFKGPANVVYALTFSPDGQQIAAVGGGDKQAYLWDVSDGKLCQSFVGHTKAVMGLSFFSDGKRLLTTSWDGTIRVWDTGTGVEIRRIEKEISAEWGTAVLFPSERKAAVGGYDMLAIVDVETGALLQQMPWPGGRVTQVSVSTDGTRLLTASGDNGDGRLRLWDPANGDLIRAFERLPAENALPIYANQAGSTWRVAYLSDGRHCLTAEGNRASIRSVRTGEVLHRFDGHTDCVMAIALSATGRYAVTGGPDQKVRLWRVPSLPAHAPESMAEPSVLIPKKDKTELTSFNPRKDRALKTYHTYNMPVHVVAISPNENVVAVGGGDWRHGNNFKRGTDVDVRLFDRETGKQLRRLKGPTAPIFALAFSPDGQLIAAADGAGHRAYLWAVDDGKLLHTFVGHTAPIVCAVFSSDGKQLLTTSWDGTIRLWDTGTGAAIRRLDAANPAQTAAYLPGDKEAVVGGMGWLAIINVETGAGVRVFPWPGGRVRTLAVRPDGKQFLTAGGDYSDGRIRLWETATGKLTRTFGNIPVGDAKGLPNTPPGSAIGVAWLPDGKRFLTAEGNASCLRDADTAKILHIFDGHADCVMAVAVSTKGRFAVSGGLDQKARLWPLPGLVAGEKADGN